MTLVMLLLRRVTDERPAPFLQRERTQQSTDKERALTEHFLCAQHFIPAPHDPGAEITLFVAGAQNSDPLVPAGCSQEARPPPAALPAEKEEEGSVDRKRAGWVSRPTPGPYLLSAVVVVKHLILAGAS